MLYCKERVVVTYTNTPLDRMDSDNLKTQAATCHGDCQCIGHLEGMPVHHAVATESLATAHWHVTRIVDSIRVAAHTRTTTMPVLSDVLVNFVA